MSTKTLNRSKALQCRLSKSHVFFVVCMEKIDRRQDTLQCPAAVAAALVPLSGWPRSAPGLQAATWELQQLQVLSAVSGCLVTGLLPAVATARLDPAG